MSEVQIWCEPCDMATPLHIDHMEADDLREAFDAGWCAAQDEFWIAVKP